MRNIIIRMCMDGFGILIMCGIFIVYMMQKTPLLKTLTRTEDVVAKIIVAAILGGLIWNYAIPFIRDIPYIVEGKYLTIEGTAITRDEGWNSSKAVTIEDKRTKEEIRVDFGYKKGIEIGDELIVQYIPYSHYGILIEHNGKQIHNYIE